MHDAEVHVSLAALAIALLKSVHPLRTRWPSDTLKLAKLGFHSRPDSWVIDLEAEEDSVSVTQEISVLLAVHLLLWFGI